MDVMTSELNPLRNDVSSPVVLHGTDTDFRAYLRDELVRRNRRNPRFSLRAFARVLDVEASALSKILNGKRALTYRMFQRFSVRLELNPEQIAGYAKSMADVPNGTRRARRVTAVNLNRPDDSRALINVSTQVNKIEEALAQLDAVRRDLSDMLRQAAKPKAEDLAANLSSNSSSSMEQNPSYYFRLTLAPLRNTASQTVGNSTATPSAQAVTNTVIN